MECNCTAEKIKGFSKNIIKDKKNKRFLRNIIKERISNANFKDKL